MFVLLLNGLIVSNFPKLTANQNIEVVATMRCQVDYWCNGCVVWQYYIFYISNTSTLTPKLIFYGTNLMIATRISKCWKKEHLYANVRSAFPFWLLASNWSSSLNGIRSQKVHQCYVSLIKTLQPITIYSVFTVGNFNQNKNGYSKNSLS